MGKNKLLRQGNFAYRENLLATSKNLFSGGNTMSKTAIITGGGSGLGQSTALRMAQEGVNIAVVDVSEKGGNETVELVKGAGADAIFIKADVSKAEEVKNYVDKTVEHFGSVDYF